MQEKNEKTVPFNVDWEKIGVYIAVMLAFTTLFFYIADMKERIRALEVEVAHLKEQNIP